MVSRIKLKKPLKGTLLIVDFLSVYYRGAFAHTGLEYEGTPTGGLYGMVQQMCTTIVKTRPTDVIFCTDSKPYLRAAECPDYKADRKKKTEEEVTKLLLEQDMCQEFVKNWRLPLIKRKGFEADDLIALIVKNNHLRFNKIVIASGDTDLYQLLIYSNVEIYQGSKKGIYTGEHFRTEFCGLQSPAQWNEVLAYSGGHNGLGGIKGIGIKTAIKLVMGIPVSDKVKDSVIANKEKVIKNIRVGKLPFYQLTNEDITVPFCGRYKERELLLFLHKYGITMSESMRDIFELVHESNPRKED